ncbi:transcriptional repressor LexA [Geobacter pickeringii]|uniref:LexA repressor n=1 Tax=Geobacter pickeringii TaxID=345632 RepID=A0A0B5BA86_9BACT|nr:transcriptional repressor LexA [Geobacter pickeringii]AJE03502.1 LexA family transcriptional regulator [Geobacter pickeringii]
MENLTPRQKEVLAFLGSYLARHGYPPTMRDIAAHLRINGTLGVMKHLAALEKKGYIRRAAGNSRGISLMAPGAQPVSLPVVGVVRAGMLQPAIEDVEGYLAIDEAQLKGGTFFLRVKGDSMVNAAILDGDLALIRPQPTANNHDIVVAMVDGEATLKAFYREPGQIRLQPRNPNMEPIIVREGEGDVAIVGKVVGIFRTLE